MNESVATESVELSNLDHAVRQWILRMGGNGDLATVAAWVSYANRQANAAASLDDIRSWSGKALGADVLDHPLVLSAEQAVLHPETRMPLVRDDKDRVFLFRNFMAERYIAQRILERVSSSVSEPVDDGVIDRLFGGGGDGTDRLQRDAVRQAAGQRVFLLAGGPGTGKTTTVFRMLMAGALEPQDVELAAPTGKAAKRLTEALRTEAAKQEQASGFGSLQAKTVHRWLIEMQQGLIRAPKALVIDEASMLDLDLLQQVLEVLPLESRLILVGDPNQLMSVGTGTVLADLVVAFAGSKQMVELQHNYRVASSPKLVRLNESALRNEPDTFVEIVGGLRPVETPVELASAIDDWTAGFSADLDHATSVSDAAERAALHLRLTRQRQILCALRGGRYGVQSLNREIETRLPRLNADRAQQGEWFDGRRILVTENNYALGLFNGDVGVCVVDSESNRREVWFEDAPDENGNPQYRAVPVASLPAHEPAWAMTIHKSQGSEYSRIAVVLPPDTGSRILSRQLIYTAVSRAKSDAQVTATADAISVWGTREVLEVGLATTAARVGGLTEALTRQ